MQNADIGLDDIGLDDIGLDDIGLDDVRLSDDRRLAHCDSFADVAKVLMGTRNMVDWSSTGHAVAAYEIALTYAQLRTQFGRPIAATQLVQAQLVQMLGEVTAMQLYCIRLGRLIDAGQMTDTMAALAKYFCSVKAREVCRTARDILGGNGITLDFHVIRHLCDMEALVTYEGTAEIQTLIVGRDVTGISAFSQPTGEESRRHAHGSFCTATDRRDGRMHILGFGPACIACESPHRRSRFMHIRVVIPVIGETLVEHIRSEVEGWAAPDTKVDVVPLERGTASIESEYDEALAAPGILQRVEEAAADGVDGVFVTCFGDPGVHAAREIIDAPVVGGFEPAVLTALSLGEHVGIITVLPNVLPMLNSLARRYTIERRIGTIRVVDLPVLGLEDHDVLIERLFEQASDAVSSGQADVIVLGCTGMLGVANELRDRLVAAGHDVPVIDPTGAAITWLESSIRLGVRPSRTTYMPPPVKDRSA